jgi:2-keto-4-pentenoate hydratase/2-oxohepta-3-ene-1,7-dioic acid hydratase in catechol pathway
MRFQRLGREGAERPAVLDEQGRAFDLSPITPDIDGAFLSDNGIAAAMATLPRLSEVDTRGLRVGAPVVFMKASNTVVGPDDHVLIPRGSTKTDYEIELAEL